MNAIAKERVLRLNCPGFGEESYLTIGKARELEKYEVIIVNPVSILHLFDKEPDTLRDIDAKINEGLTSYNLKSDDLLKSLESDLKKRIFELVTFLEKGGLLIYYLCRPFLIQGPGLAMDNYYWLESLAPDQPSETNVRHMSSVSQGRIVEPTPHAESSEFAAYFKQPGLEWSTIIRTDFLTHEYIPLAMAGPRKCIAAHLVAGDNGGRIVFFPSPYSPDFDRSLMECANLWYQGKPQSEEAQSVPPPQVQPTPAPQSPKPEQAPPPEPASAAPGDAPPSFGQPDPNKFLSARAPEPGDSPMRTGDQPQMKTGDQPQMKTGDQPSIRSPNAASISRSGLPPVPKFRTSRAMPDAQPAKLTDEVSPGGTIEPLPPEKITAEKILESVSQQVEKAAGDPEGKEFNERATADIHAAFSTLNQPLPQPSTESGSGIPSAIDLLKELESPSAAQILKEFEIMAEPAAEIPAQPQAEDPKAGESKAAPPPISPAPTEKPAPSSAPAPSPAEISQQKLPPPRTPTADATPSPRPRAEAAPGGDANWTAAASEAKPLFEQLAEKAQLNQSQESQYQRPSAPSQKAEAPAKNSGQGEAAATPVVEQKESPPPSTPEAKDLMKKMEEISKTTAPEWCAQFSLPDLEELKRERAGILEQIKALQSKIAAIDHKIASLDNLKNVLLSSDGEDLQMACIKVFKRLGFSPQVSPSAKDELHLSGASGVEMIALVARSTTQIQRTEIIRLSSSLNTYWGETGVEPKGMLLAQTWSNTPPAARTDSDFADGVADFAEKKNLCLMTTIQLLSIYRDVEMGVLSADDARKRLLETSGKLPGFDLSDQKTRTPAG